MSNQLIQLAHVRIRDFKRLDGFGERGPCDVCDGKYVHYIERMTKERQKTKRKAFRMCRSLADEAGVFLGELITYLDADGEDRVLVTEPESVLAATVRFWDRWKESLAG